MCVCVCCDRGAKSHCKPTHMSTALCMMCHLQVFPTDAVQDEIFDSSIRVSACLCWVLVAGRAQWCLFLDARVCVNKARMRGLAWHGQYTTARPLTHSAMHRTAMRYHHAHVLHVTACPWLTLCRTRCMMEWVDDAEYGGRVIERTQPDSACLWADRVGEDVHDGYWL